MKVLLINSVCGIRGTGRICTDIAEEFEKQGHEVKIAYGRAGVPEKYIKYAVRIGTKSNLRLHGIKTRFSDKHGLGSCKATKEFLAWAEEYNPDLLWLHNIHGYYINYEMLFDWIKAHPDMEVRWTLHDCWAFTGHCAYFSNINCEKWKSGCFSCPQKHTYPESLIKDNSEENYKRKKAAFCGVSKMTIITPSQWLFDLANQSFLKEYEFKLIKNEIDKNVFKPTQGNFREEYNLENKKIVLGVANIWNKRKGYSDFLKLSKLLPDDFAIVMVGLTKKQLKEIPPRIIGIGHTDSAKELAEIYTAADVFVNTTYEDNYPTVNLEAEACGTKVYTYNTGGCRETINRQDSKVTPCDINILAETIIKGIK
ncbi:MAG: glycosyltransferase [Clostridia bacterium]|nr:glycosyltransferase [Clostridia bacterium]